MKKLSLALTLSLAACGTATQPIKQEPLVYTRSFNDGVSAYTRVAARVEPVAERICRDIHSSRPSKFCDFDVRVEKSDTAPNAYQTIDQSGRPVVTFNSNMLRTIKNDHEIAFILGHEFGHQIAQHISKMQRNATAGGLLGAILIGAAGGDPQIGVDLGMTIGARAYSKDHELQADRLGAYIAEAAGYDATIGAQSFQRFSGSGAFLATHPLSNERISTVANTVSEIDAAKAKGQDPRPHW